MIAEYRFLGALLLVIMANMAPWASGRLLRGRLAADAASSFTKRRLRLSPGAEVPALDQLPEALLPLLVLARPLGVSLLEAVGIALIFLCLDLAARPLRHSRALQR